MRKNKKIHIVNLTIALIVTLLSNFVFKDDEFFYGFFTFGFKTNPPMAVVVTLACWLTLLLFLYSVEIIIYRVKNKKPFHGLLFAAIGYIIGFLFLQVYVGLLNNILFVHLMMERPFQGNIISIFLNPVNYYFALPFVTVGLIIDGVIALAKRGRG